MCVELCGNRDVLEDKVSNVLASMVDQMVENVVDFSCMYARHRDSDTLEKEDVAFAVSKLFPEVARDHPAKDVQ
jgi:transcription initiation factor TFIID subunit TAF12|tara:strand:- start:89 stop:310 length:222 start_codon:yes stop_codon:yes gene_type:complete